MARAGLAILTILFAVGLGAYLTVPELRPNNRFWAAMVLSGFVLVFALVLRAYLNWLLVPRLRSAHNRYLAHKSIGAIVVAVTLAALAVIWVKNPQTLGVSLGIVGAGVAVALQKPITSAFALVVILTNRMFRVGDRIQIEDTRGDVIDVHVFHTKLMEIGEWMEGETWTGRIVTVPNFMFLEKRVHNYTKDFNFLWDAVTVPITLDSNWETAERILLDAMKEHTSELEEQAHRELGHMSADYLVPAARTAPRTYVRPTDDWIEVLGRFVTTARGRKGMKSRILKDVMARIEDAPDVEIAAERLRLNHVGGGERDGAPA